MTGIVIQKGIPLPSKKGRPQKWLPVLESIAVGDSFVVTYTVINSVRCAYRQLRDKKFTSRTVDDYHVRIWRVV